MEKGIAVGGGARVFVAILALLLPAVPTMLLADDNQNSGGEIRKPMDIGDSLGCYKIVIATDVHGTKTMTLVSTNRELSQILIKLGMVASDRRNDAYRQYLSLMHASKDNHLVLDFDLVDKVFGNGFLPKLSVSNPASPVEFGSENAQLLVRRFFDFDDAGVGRIRMQYRDKAADRRFIYLLADSGYLPVAGDLIAGLTIYPRHAGN